MTTDQTVQLTRPARLPPRWFIRIAWSIHRGLYRLLGQRRALRPVTEKDWGMLRLTTVGRKSGKPRAAILGYYEDGANLVTMAMNGWGEPEPAWWLNLQERPETTVEMQDGRTLRVRGRPATSEERPRLWELWRRYDGEKLDSWAARRPGETAVVILEPIST
ncbi:MAG TPA: nitroreductase family deazaflavin-dependent oxidoreductase [Vitreimonas sp.]|jgi:F420H(2)-dependent quinone reductase|nr:nitroreductase family deazaflavin-dependent oxidoreductase [Vitreimonas sp.]